MSTFPEGLRGEARPSPDAAVDAFELAPVLMGVVEPIGEDVLHVRDNRAASAFVGVGPGETTNRLASEMGASPGTIREWVVRYEESAVASRPVRFEFSYGPAHDPEWLSVVVRALGAGPSGRRRFLYVAESITAQKRAERAARDAEELAAQRLEQQRQSDERFRAAMETMQDGVTILTAVRDQDGHLVDFRIDYMNEAGARQSGRPRDALLGQPVLGLRPDYRMTTMWTGYQNLVAEGGFYGDEVVVPGVERGTRARVLEVRATRLGDGVAAVWRDVTERHLTQEALRRERDFTNAVLDVAGALVVVLDRNARVTRFNRACESVSGRSASEVVGAVIWDLNLIPPEDMLGVDEKWRALLAGQFPNTHENDWVARDASRRAISWSNTAIRNTQGEVEFVISTGIDVTDRRRMIEQLREADRRKDEFLATLAHELRNPLAPILNAIEYLKTKDLDDAHPSPGVAVRAVIDRQVHHMARILEDLLDVSRISRNKLVLRKERLEIAGVLDAAIETSRPHIDAGGHRLTLQLDPGPLVVDGDPVRLAQILANLLNNAAKYTPPGGTITVSAGRESDAVVISVRDNGIGIAPEALPTIFEMFAQEAPALERAQGGLGIGLSLVRGLVALHGGAVEARSDGPQRGSEFLVRLPAVEPAPLASAPRRDASVGRGQRVLVVDDNPDNADTLAMLIESLGHEVRTAYDGAAALTTAAQFSPTLILLDVGMPHMNGFEACRKLRETSPRGAVVIVAVTGWGQPEDRRRTSEAGFDAHLVKPVDRDALFALLAGRPEDRASST